jgi:hypothetical protein
MRLTNNNELGEFQQSIESHHGPDPQEDKNSRRVTHNNIPDHV